MSSHSADALSGAAMSSSNRSLDFVRSRMKALEIEKNALQLRLSEAERELSHFQSAQAIALERADEGQSDGWSQIQADKVREMTLVFAKAQEGVKALRAKEYKTRRETEKFILLKHALQREREDKAAMHERLEQAFAQGKSLLIENQALKAQLDKQNKIASNDIKRLRGLYEKELESVRNKIDMSEPNQHQSVVNAIVQKFITDLDALQDKLKKAHETVTNI